MTTAATCWNCSCARMATISGGQIPIPIKTPPATPSGMRRAALNPLQGNYTRWNSMDSRSLPSFPGQLHEQNDPRSKARIVVFSIQLYCQRDGAQAARLIPQSRRYDVIVHMLEQAFAGNISVQQIADSPANP